MERCTTYKCHSPSSYMKESSDSEVNSCHIREPQPFNPRKRPPQESSQPLLKRQQLSHPSGSQPPPAFWNNLSKIWLTKRALKEFDRRSTQSSSSTRHSSYRRPQRPVTRYRVAKWKQKEENWEPTEAAADFFTHCSTGRLEEIKLLTRHGGPDLSDLRGYRKPVCPFYHTMSSNQSSSRRRKRNSISAPTTNTATSRNTGPYDRNFQQNLIDGRVYPHRYEHPDGRVPAKPNNWDEVNERLAQPRPSLSPSNFSEEAYENFVRADAHAFKERQVMESVIPIIEGEIKDGRSVSGGIPFTNLAHLTDGTLVPGNPDRYYGSRPEQLDWNIRNELSAQIIPSTQHDLPIAPNFFLAGKGPDGSAAVAGRQASYDGALGARGIYSLQSYGQDKPVHDNNAYTVTSMYHNGQLKMYTSHISLPDNPNSRPEFYMTQLKAYAMTNDSETFRKGAAAFRNAIDWTKEQRDKAIKQANKRLNNSQAGALAADSCFDLTTEASKEPYTGESLGQDSGGQVSRTSLNEIQESNTSERSHKSKRVQRNTSDAGRSHGPAETFISKSSSKSGGKTQPREEGRGRMVNSNVAKGRHL